MTDYDKISEEYQKSKLHPWRQYIEKYTAIKILGNLDNKNVLDVACGNGIYSRIIKTKLNAKYVTGVDISKNMIELAKKYDNNNDISNIEYYVYDALELPVLGNYDVVFASYLLNYAKNKDELYIMCKNIYDNLKHGGKFVGINDSPMDNNNNYKLFSKYKLKKMNNDPNRSEGSEIIYSFIDDDNQEILVINYYWKPETYQSILLEVGFREFSWVYPSLDPNHGFGNEYWNDFMCNSPIIGFTVYKL
jgi:ubiquinone/menaquinone biosynthesis C-methylase UbiE